MLLVSSGRAGVTWQHQMTSDQGTSAADPLHDRNTFVTPKNHGLNPNANEFHSKVPSPSSSTASAEPQWPANDETTAVLDDSQTAGVDVQDFTYMNGDVNLVDDAAYDGATIADDSPPLNDVADDYYDPGAEPVEPMTPIALDNGYGEDVNDVAMVTPVMVQTSEVAPPTVLLSPTSLASPVIPVQMSVSPGMEEQPVVSSSEEGSSPTTNKSDGPRDLRRLLRDQLEYYFSPENLASDSYLYSQMDADHFVAISTIANFNMVKRLTGDLGLIVDVLKESPVVQVDEAGEKVRPLHKRCIVILREVPQSTPVEIVKDLFSGENCPRFISCEFAINNSWYITFDSDEDAQRAYRYLREERQTFLGKPIMARIKAKPLVRSTYVPKNGVKAGHHFSPAAPQFTPQTQPVQAQVASPQSAAAGVQYTAPPTSSYSPPIQGLSYINSQPQQTFSPAFFPSHGAAMVPAWPTSQFFDPGMVFAVNGFQPQATFKHTRPFSFQNIRQRNQGKPPLGRNHSTMAPMERNEAPTRPNIYDRQHSAPPAPVSHRSGSNRGGESYHSRDGSQSGPQHRREGGSDRHNWREAPQYGGHYDRSSGYSPHMDGHGLPPRLEKDRRTSYRSRGMGRRGRDDDSGASKPSSRSAGHLQTAPPTGEARVRQAPPSPRFELEPTGFPPLPGANNQNTSGEVFENKMSDVVRGTAKPSTREARDYRPDSSPVKDPPVTNGSATKQNSSPKKNEKPTESSPDGSTSSTTASEAATSASSDVSAPSSKSRNASSSEKSSSASRPSQQPSSSSAMTNGTSAAPASSTGLTSKGGSSIASVGSSGASTSSGSGTTGAGTAAAASTASKIQKSQPAKEEKSEDHQTASPIPAKISYAQMVARAKAAANGSDSDSGPLSPAGDDDSSKEDTIELSNGRKEAWERKEEPREPRRERRSNRERRERRPHRSPTK